MKKLYTFILISILLAQSITAEQASTFLGDNSRTGYTKADIPTKPTLLWTYKERHKPVNAWKEPMREIQYIDFDYVDHTAISENLVFFGSSADHTIRALDLKTGKEKWVYYTEGPIRTVPVIFKDKVYTASDDGNIYCLKTSDGSLVWKFRGGPANDRHIGNEQMVSKWPCRSGVMIENGKLYTTAGMWSRDGVFIYCLDADNGKIIWKNDTSGFHWMSVPHSRGFGGVTPQGPLALYKDILYITTGRAMPAYFDAKTGEFLYHQNGEAYKSHYPGGTWMMASHDWIIFKRRTVHSEENVRYTERSPADGLGSGIIMANYKTGELELALSDKVHGVVYNDALFLGGVGPVIRVNINKMKKEYQKYFKDNEIIGMDSNVKDSSAPYIPNGYNKKVAEFLNKSSSKGNVKSHHPAIMNPTPIADWKSKDLGRTYSMMIANDKILVGGKNEISLLSIDTGKIILQKKVKGKVYGITVEKDKFILSTTEGYIYCFGKGSADSQKEISFKQSWPEHKSDTKQIASQIIKELEINEGYCLMLGTGNGDILFELIKKTKLQIYCLEPDAKKRLKLQQRLDKAMVLGKRAQIHSGSFDKIPYATYVANGILWGDKLGSSADKIDIKGLYRTLRPWEGKAIEVSGSNDSSKTKKLLIKNNIPGNEISTGKYGTIITRGPLKGAGEWTRVHADNGNTSSSDDDLVKLPLGILWWGGVGPARIVSRHYRSPVPLFTKGNMFIQGQHDIIGVDAYNGREMWNFHLTNVGRYPPTRRGGNIITDGDRVYCVHNLTCYALDAKTGKIKQKYIHEITSEQKKETEEIGGFLLKKGDNSFPVWEYLGLAENRIIGTLSMEGEAKDPKSYNYPSISHYIFAYDKKTGKKAWDIKLDKTVLPMGIVTDKKHLYYLDRIDEGSYLKMKRQGKIKNLKSSLRAIRLSDGKTVWENKNIPVERKTLILKNGVIIAIPNPEETIEAEAQTGISAFDAKTGKMLWDKSQPDIKVDRRRANYPRYTFIANDILYIPWAVDIRTGKEILRGENLLTGKPMRYSFPSQNFCGNIAAGNHITAFRSAAVGFQELNRNTPAHWLPEVRTSCWINTVPAGGLLLAPEGYSTCVCPYNYKTSLALIPVQREEDWGIYYTSKVKRNRGKNKKSSSNAEFKHLKLNLNAAGDKLDSDDAPFFSWPHAKTIGGIPNLPVSIPKFNDGFRYNSDYYKVENTDRPWIYTSGIIGELLLVFDFPSKGKKYKVILHFMEPEKVKKGDRVFDVMLSNKKILSKLDIINETGGSQKALKKEISGLSLKGTVKLSLESVSGKPPFLCAVEIIAE